MGATGQGAKTYDAAELTVADVAKLLSLSPDHVRALIVAGHLAAVNMAREVGPGNRARWRVSQAAVAAFQAARSNVPQPAVPAASEPASGGQATSRPKGGEEFV
jgi:excisionase family DNA binding protein